MTPQVHVLKPVTKPVRLLPLAYGDVDENILHQVEEVCKAHGISLEQIELIGQDAGACMDFLHIARVVGVEAALLSTDWLSLEQSLRERA